MNLKHCYFFKILTIQRCCLKRTLYIYMVYICDVYINANLFSVRSKFAQQIICDFN